MSLMDFYRLRDLQSSSIWNLGVGNPKDTNRMLLIEIKELRIEADVAIRGYHTWMDCFVQGFVLIVFLVSEELDLVGQRPYL